MSRSDLRPFLGQLADAAEAAILPHFRTRLGVDSKGTGRFDPVTAADRGAEEAMRRLIESTFPDDGIVGEEFGGVRQKSHRVWVLDPIDGTRSFIAGLPIWGILIGLLEGGAPVLGMMAQPFTGERYSGDGRAAWYSGPGGPRTLAVRPCPRLEDAVLFTTSPHEFAAAEEVAYRRAEKGVRLARYGADCYAYCMLAAGFVDAVIEAGLKQHDIAPLIPIIEGAGGQVTNWFGGSAAGGGQVLATGDRALHDRLLALLAG